MTCMLCKLRGDICPECHLHDECYQTVASSDNRKWCDSKYHEIDISSDSEDSGESEADTETAVRNLEFLHTLSPEAFENYQQAVKYIEETRPKPPDVLMSGMETEDRAKILRYLEVALVLPPCVELLDLEDRIAKMITKAKERFDNYEKYDPARSRKNKLQTERGRMRSLVPPIVLEDKILDLEADDRNKAVIFRKYTDLNALNAGSEEYARQYSWLVQAVRLPFLRRSPSKFSFECKRKGCTSKASHGIDEIAVRCLRHKRKTDTAQPDALSHHLRRVRKTLNESLYGMNKIKEEFIVRLHHRLRIDKTDPKGNGRVTALVGPPGVGKTAIVQAVAESVGRECVTIRCGGVKEPEILTGQLLAWIGGAPGRVAQAMMQAKVSDPIVILEELDKIDDRVVPALLHLLDPKQNHDYTDAFFSEISIDLSKVWWICTMNQMPSDPALSSRLSCLTVKGYNFEDKCRIIRHYLLPAALKEVQLPIESATMDVSGARVLCTSADQTSAHQDKQGVRRVKQLVHFVVDRLYYLAHTHDKDASFYHPKACELPVVLTSEIITALMEGFTDNGDNMEWKSIYG